MDQAAFIAITVGLVQVIKIAMPKSALLNRFIPVIALVIGVAVTSYQGFSADSAIAGIITGLSAMGLYSGAKHTTS